jgi:hypothetical protein
VGVWFLGRLIGGQLQPGSDAREADFFALEALPERMAFPTDLMICEKLKKLLVDEENGLEQLYEEYSEYLKA